MTRNSSLLAHSSNCRTCSHPRQQHFKRCCAARRAANGDGPHSRVPRGLSLWSDLMTPMTKKKLLIIIGGLFVASVAVAGVLYLVLPVQLTTYGGMAVNALRSFNAP